jgi:type I restriction-modification system DNA methylase subunit
MAKKKTTDANKTGANLGFEAKLWLAADKLRNNMDAAEYKHVVLGLIFLKYISDSFEEHRAKLMAGEGVFTSQTRENQKKMRFCGDTPVSRTLRGRYYLYSKPGGPLSQDTHTSPGLSIYRLGIRT